MLTSLVLLQLVVVSHLNGCAGTLYLWSQNNMLALPRPKADCERCGILVLHTHNLKIFKLEVKACDKDLVFLMVLEEEAGAIFPIEESIEDVVFSKVVQLV